MLSALHFVNFIAERFSKFDNGRVQLKIKVWVFSPALNGSRMQSGFSRREGLSPYECEDFKEGAFVFHEVLVPVDDKPFPDEFFEPQ